MFRRTLSLVSLSLIAACGTEPAQTGEEGAPGTVIGSDSGSADGGGLDADSDATGADGGLLDTGLVPDTDVDAEDGGTISFDVGGSDAEPIDAGPGPDVSEPDTAQPCVPGATSCDGGLLLVCTEASTLVRRRCDPGTECRVGADGQASCESTGVLPGICEPLEVRCSSTGRAIEQCDERGSGWLPVQECPFGCDAEDVECLDEDDVVVPGSCDDPSIEVRAPGEFQVDLCDYDDTTDLVSGGACSSGDSGEGRDYTFSFTVERRSRVVVETWDDDPNAPIDTIIALRTACTAEESQIACHDDLPCAESSFFASNTCSGSGSGSVQVRHSRISIDLEPGTYYAVVDQFDYRASAGTFGCGIVSVRLNVSPL